MGRLVWASITTAVISRAAKQLSRVAQADNPAGMPLGEPSTLTSEIGNTGICHSLQPSPLTSTASSPRPHTERDASEGMQCNAEGPSAVSIDIDADED